MKNSYSDIYFERMGEHMYNVTKQLKMLRSPDIQWGEWDDLPQEQRAEFIGLAILTLPIHEFAGGNPSLIPKVTLEKKPTYVTNP